MNSTVDGLESAALSELCAYFLKDSPPNPIKTELIPTPSLDYGNFAPIISTHLGGVLTALPLFIRKSLV